MARLRVGVLGASGYAGLELMRLLVHHPEIELAAVSSEQRAGQPVGEAFPSLRGLVDLRFEPADAEALVGRVDLAMTALPTGTSTPLVAWMRKAGVAVVDLSGEFRLRDAADHERTYGPHAAPELFGQAAYGLPELHRDAIRGADFVAAPGCYPTCVVLPLAPLLREGLVGGDRLFIDAKSGASGAGRKLAEDYLLAELADSVHAYKVGGVHKHVLEIEQELGAVAGRSLRVSFVPHLLPIARGMVATAFADPAPGVDAAAARETLVRAYADEPFVRVLPAGETPRIASVRGSNFCDVAVFDDARTGGLVVLSALDNLGKGAAGAMVQCANLMRGFPETTGLLGAPLVP